VSRRRSGRATGARWTRWSWRRRWRSGRHRGRHGGPEGLPCEGRRSGNTRATPRARWRRCEGGGYGACSHRHRRSEGFHAAAVRAARRPLRATSLAWRRMGTRCGEASDVRGERDRDVELVGAPSCSRCGRRRSTRRRWVGRKPPWRKRRSRGRGGTAFVSRQERNRTAGADEARVIVSQGVASRRRRTSSWSRSSRTS